MARIPRISEPIGLSNKMFPVFRAKTLILCLNTAGFDSDNPADRGGGGERKPMTARAVGCTPTFVSVSEAVTDKTASSGFLLTTIAEKILSPGMKFIEKHTAWRSNIQMILEKAIIDCRFFTLLAIAGSLVGSILCFVEGCILTVDSYFHYFQVISQMSDQSHVVPVLIEAIDMFLVGSAMFTFGMALHKMFVGQDSHKGRGAQKLPLWIGIESPMHAKSKIGHAVMMILQVQVLEKLKNISVTNGIDLAYFAGAVFLSSASIFILSRTVTDRSFT